jgi:hypothetical protein
VSARAATSASRETATTQHVQFAAPPGGEKQLKSDAAKSSLRSGGPRAALDAMAAARVGNKTASWRLVIFPWITARV